MNPEPGADRLADAAAYADNDEFAQEIQTRGTWHPGTTTSRSPRDRAAIPWLPRPLKLGGRGSELARAYADRAIATLTAAAAAAGIDLAVEYVPITTSADWHSGDLAELGGKALFCREVDHALASGTIDAAIHALKDVPGDVAPPPGLTFAAYLERDDVRDAIVFPATSPYTALADLPAGARIGTSAVRRRAQILRARPDLAVVAYRGNVIPRIQRLDDQYASSPHGPETVDGLLLARGGLAQVGMGHRASQVLQVGEMCPAVGAGVLGLRCRKTDRDLVGLLSLADHAATRARIDAERSMLSVLGGHCQSPIAGHCEITGDHRLSLIGMVFDADGATVAHAHAYDEIAHARDLGAYVAASLIRQDARAIIDGTARTR